MWLHFAVNEIDVHYEQELCVSPCKRTVGTHIFEKECRIGGIVEHINLEILK